MSESNLAINDIDILQNRSEALETLKLIMCGSVDDGKSTLIGRILYESDQIPSDTLKKLHNESSPEFINKNLLDFSLACDGLLDEKEQGITIDICYRYFNTFKRNFILIDSPGHEQYTRNMATGASQADAAFVLVDANKGVSPQTKRHTYICNMMGIKKFIFCLNKIDIIEYNKEKIYRIES